MTVEIKSSPLSRQTKYVDAAYQALQTLRHATNIQILHEIQKTYPDVSATTIHRVTARLKSRGLISCAPKSANGSEHYDITPEPHHHFVCDNCFRICDMPETNEAQQVINQLKKLSGDCAIAGTLTMRGICRSCSKEYE